MPADYGRRRRDKRMEQAVERWLWVQDYSDRIFTQRESADALVSMVAGKFTDVMIATRADNNGRVWFNSELTEMRPEQIDGEPGGVYLLKKLHGLGIRVHAWFYTGFWGTYLRMLDPPPDYWNMNDRPEYVESWCDFSVEGMRNKVALHVSDIMLNNDLDGAHLDYLRLRGDNLDSPFVTYDHITDVARRVRAGIGNKILTASFSGRGADMANRQRRDVWTWLTEPGLFDGLQMMSYVTVPLDEKLAWLQSLPNNERVLPGVPTFWDDDGRYRPSLENLVDHVVFWQRNWRYDLALFDSVTFTQEMHNALSYINPYPVPEYDLSGVIEKVGDLSRSMNMASIVFSGMRDALDLLIEELEKLNA